MSPALFLTTPGVPGVAGVVLTSFETIQPDTPAELPALIRTRYLRSVSACSAVDVAVPDSRVFAHHDPDGAAELVRSISTHSYGAPVEAFRVHDAVSDSPEPRTSDTPDGAAGTEYGRAGSVRLADVDPEPGYVNATDADTDAENVVVDPYDKETVRVPDPIFFVPIAPSDQSNDADDPEMPPPPVHFVPDCPDSLEAYRTWNHTS